jgi:hypothetical protein
MNTITSSQLQSPSPQSEREREIALSVRSLLTPVVAKRLPLVLLVELFDHALHSTMGWVEATVSEEDALSVLSEFSEEVRARSEVLGYAVRVWLVQEHFVVDAEGRKHSFGAWTPSPEAGVGTEFWEIAVAATTPSVAS